MTQTATTTATKTAAHWLRDNGFSRKTAIREAVQTATSQALDYGKAYALSLWAGDDTTSRLVRDALKANPNLPFHGTLANCA
jgi:hypothetical protein